MLLCLCKTFENSCFFECTFKYSFIHVQPYRVGGCEVARRERGAFEVFSGEEEQEDEAEVEEDAERVRRPRLR